MHKFELRVAFQTGTNLRNTLSKNKDKLIPNSYPGVYELKCSCGSEHNGEINSTKGCWGHCLFCLDLKLLIKM